MQHNFFFGTVLCVGVHVYGNKFPLTMVNAIRNGAPSFLNSLPSTIASNNFKNKRVSMPFCLNTRQKTVFVMCMELGYFRDSSFL